MGEIPTYSQPESYEAPEAMQEQVLQSAQVKSIIDEYEKQGEREKAQAELIVTTIQQKNETSGGKTIPWETAALSETVQKIINAKVFKAPPLPEVEDFANTPISDKIFRKYKEAEDKIGLEKTSEENQEGKDIQTDIDKQNQEATQNSIKDINTSFDTLSANPDMAAILNSAECQKYIADAQANPNDEIVKTFSGPNEIAQQVPLLKARYLLNYLQTKQDEPAVQKVLSDNRVAVSALALSYNTLADSKGFDRIELKKPTAVEKEQVKEIEDKGVTAKDFHENKKESGIALEQSSVIQKRDNVNATNLLNSAKGLDISGLTDKDGNPLDQKWKADYEAKLAGILQSKSNAGGPMELFTTVSNLIPARFRSNLNLDLTKADIGKDGTVELPLNVKSTIKSKLKISANGEVIATNPLHINPRRNIIGKQDMVLGSISPLSYFDEESTSTEVAAEFATRLEKEAKAKNITKADDRLKLAADLYPKVLEEMTADKTEGQTNISTQLDDILQKQLLIDAVNKCYPLNDGLADAEYRDKNTDPYNAERVRLMSLLVNTQAPFLDTDDFAKLTDSFNRFHQLQQDALAINGSVEFKNHDKADENWKQEQSLKGTLETADPTKSKLDTLVTDYYGAYENVPEQYQGRLNKLSVGRNTLANTYLWAGVDPIEKFVSIPANWFSKNDVLAFDRRTKRATNRVPINAEKLEGHPRPPKIKEYYDKSNVTALNKNLDEQLAKVV